MMEPQCLIPNDSKCQNIVNTVKFMVQEYVTTQSDNTNKINKQPTVVEKLERLKGENVQTILSFLKIPVQVTSISPFEFTNFSTYKYKHFKLTMNTFRRQMASGRSVRLKVSGSKRKEYGNDLDFVIVKQHDTRDYVLVNINGASNQRWLFFHPNNAKDSKKRPRIINAGEQPKNAKESPLFVCTFIHFWNERYYGQYISGSNRVNITRDELQQVYQIYFAPYQLQNHGLMNNGLINQVNNLAPVQQRYIDPLFSTPTSQYNFTGNNGTLFNSRLGFNNNSSSGILGRTNLSYVLPMESKNMPNELSIVDMQYVLYYMKTRLSDDRKHARFHSVLKQFFGSRGTFNSANEWKSALDTSLKSMKRSSEQKSSYYRTWDELYNIFKSSTINKWSPDSQKYQDFILRLNDQLVQQYKRRTGQSDVANNFFLQVPMAMKPWIQKTSDFSSMSVLLTFDYKFWVMEILRTNAVRHSVENPTLKHYEIRSLDLLSWDFKSNSQEDIADFKQTFNKCTSLFSEIDAFLEKHLPDIRNHIEDSKAVETKTAPKRPRREQSFSVEIGDAEKRLADMMMLKLKTDIDNENFFQIVGEEKDQKQLRNIQPYYFPQRFNRNVDIFENKFEYEQWIDGYEFTPIQLEYYSYDSDHFKYYLYAMLKVIKTLEDLKASEFTRIVVLMINSLYSFFKATQKNDDNHEAICYVLQVLKTVLYIENSGLLYTYGNDIIKNDLRELKYFFETVELSCFDEATNAKRISRQNPRIRDVRDLIREKKNNNNDN